jgi:nucleotide-binding universal stress UspA family protein
VQIKNVLVPVDFSPPSRLAVNYAIVLARSFHARLTLLHVVESPAALLYAFPIESLKIENQHCDQAARMLASLVVHEDQDDLDLHTSVRRGSIEHEILAAIRDERADMVVMGTHGRGLLGRWFIGSVAEAMLRKLPVPVMMVSRLSRPPGFSRILFATDLSDASVTSFPAVLDFAKTMRSELVAFHAIERTMPVYQEAEAAVVDLREQLIEKARSGLATLAREAERRQGRIETVFDEGSAAELILKSAEKHIADLIVITIEDKGLLERALLGTTAERVIREAHAPVLALPAASVGAGGGTNQSEEVSSKG